MNHLHQLSVEFNTNKNPLNRSKRHIKLTCDDSTPHPRVISKTALRHVKN